MCAHLKSFPPSSSSKSELETKVKIDSRGFLVIISFYCQDELLLFGVDGEQQINYSAVITLTRRSACCCPSAPRLRRCRETRPAPSSPVETHQACLTKQIQSVCHHVSQRGGKTNLKTKRHQLVVKWAAQWTRRHTSLIFGYYMVRLNMNPKCRIDIKV